MAVEKTMITFVIAFCCIELAAGWLFRNSNRCYRQPNVGCFPVGRPYTNTMGFGPDSPAQLDVHFIYRSSSSDIRFPLRHTRRRMERRFNPSLKTVVIIHGFMESPERAWINNLVIQLKRQQERLNIFVVDWSRGANDLNYLQCAANARMAGAITALFVQDLIALGAPTSSFHIIGFSLGAHVAGYVGKRVRNIGRITGLDPAGPAFHSSHPSVRLDSSDATLVDVVHTDSELGTRRPLGTIDFYPNGGSDQTACGSSTMDRITNFVANLDFSRRSVSRAFSCSHMRAPSLFIASINNRCSYTLRRSRTHSEMRRNQGSLCRQGNCPTFGYHLNSSQAPLSGLYRFSTGGSYPYC